MPESPEGYAAKANEAEDRKDWAAAAEWWQKARGVTIGHKRSDRYYQSELRCKELARIHAPKKKKQAK